ncbi:MAG TPA: ABC transporter permease [Marmoricola sp.]|nr:ABC transporter permease [Marmoricola sp.]
MFAYIIKRLISGAIVVVLISMAVFALFWFGPRNPALPLCNIDTSNRCRPAMLQAYEHNMGFDDSVVHQYGLWAKGVVVGRTMQLGTTPYKCDAPCLGMDYRTKQPVWQELKTKFPATLSLALGASVMYLVLGVGVGVIAARRRGTWVDKSLVTGSLIISSIPFYLVAILASLWFTISLGLFPDTGYHPLTENPAKWFAGLLLPWLVLGLYGSITYTRFSRGSMVESLSEDYIRTAKAKGLPARTVVFKHALRAAMVPVVTIFGLDLATLLAGTIFAERIFSIEGIGKWGLDAVTVKNLPVVSATVLVASVAVVTSNIIVDLVYSVLDPRVRLT